MSSARMTDTQTKTKFTPGPWHIRSHIFASVETTGHHTTASGDILQIRVQIAAVNPQSNPFERRDNARLIAAAPDIYHALREARSMLRACSLEEPEDEFQATWNAGIAAVDAALAKAEGWPAMSSAP